MKEKMEISAFNYLMELKNRPGPDGKMSKVGNIKYEMLEMQQHLYENTYTNISKYISKARAKTLEIKTHKFRKFEGSARTPLGPKMPFIVATYVYASSQGQRRPLLGPIILGNLQ